MSVMEPGQVRRMQHERRRISELESLRRELVETKQRLLDSTRRERALRDENARMEVALLAAPHAEESELLRAVEDIAARDRTLRILRKQVEAAIAALQVYAKQDERRRVPHSVAAEALRLLHEDIPREESYDEPPRTGQRRARH